MNEHDLEKYNTALLRADLAERRVRQLAEALAVYAPNHPLLVDAEALR